MRPLLHNSTLNHKWPCNIGDSNPIPLTWHKALVAIRRQTFSRASLSQRKNELMLPASFTIMYVTFLNTFFPFIFHVTRNPITILMIAPISAYRLDQRQM